MKFWRYITEEDAGEEPVMKISKEIAGYVSAYDIAVPPATVLAGTRTYRRIFTMRPPPVAPDAFDEAGSHGCVQQATRTMIPPSADHVPSPTDQLCTVRRPPAHRANR